MLPTLAPSAVVPAYSVAKTFTAAAVLGAGLGIDPDRPAGDYLPAWVPDGYRRFPVRDLLTHRSGLPDYTALPAYREAVTAREDAWETAELLDRVLRMPWEGSPGQFRYSNVGYTLLRLCLEETGGGFLPVLRAAVLDPLGVTVHPLATREDWSGVTDGVARPSDYDPGWVYPGTFLASGADLAAGLAALLRSDLVAPDRRARMLVSQPVPVRGHPLDPAGYGMGVMTGGDPTRLVGHGGGGPGFTLAVLALADGTAWTSRAVADEVDDRPLFAACREELEALSGSS